MGFELLHLLLEEAAAPSEPAGAYLIAFWSNRSSMEQQRIVPLLTPGSPSTIQILWQIWNERPCCVKTCTSVKGRAESSRSQPASVGVNTRPGSRLTPSPQHEGSEMLLCWTSWSFVSEADLIKEISERQNFIFLCNQNGALTSCSSNNSNAKLALVCSVRCHGGFPVWVGWAL